MIKRFKKIKLSEELIIFMLITLAVLVMFRSIIFKNYPFILVSNDHAYQMNQFYSEYASILSEMVSKKSPIFYSWNTFLGNNFYATKVYYLTGNIFLPLLLLFKNKVLEYMFFETVLCIYISALSFNIYIKKFGINNKTNRIIFSLIYAIGGSALIMYTYPMFLRFYAVMPLLFYGVEVYLKDNKLFIFAAITCILFLQNYYFMVPTTFFLPVYFIFSSYLKDNRKGFNLLDYLIKAIKLIVAYVSGFLLSMIVLLPGILWQMGNPRLSYNEISYLLTWPIKTWLSFFFYALIPVAKAIENNPFVVNFYTDNAMIAYHYSIYIGTIGVIGIISLFFNRNIYKKHAYAVVLLLLLLANTFLPLLSLIHMGTTPTLRFTFIPAFFMMLAAAVSLDNIQRTELVKAATVAGLLNILLTSVLFVTGLMEKDNHMMIFFIVLSFVVTIVIAVIYNNKIILIGVVFLELLVGCNFGIATKIVAPYEDKLTDVLKKQYVEDDDKLFRIFINHKDVAPFNNSDLNLNFGMKYGVMTLSSYDSGMEYVTKPFLEKAGVTSSIGWGYEINKPYLYKMLGVKYVAVTDESELDDFNEYTYSHDIEYLKLYKIEDYNHIAHTYSRFADFNEDLDSELFDWNNILLVDNDLLNELSDIKESSKKQLQLNDQINSNNFSGYIDLDEKQVLFIAVPYDTGWMIKDNGVPVKYHNVNGGFIGLILETGEHNIEALYQPKGFKTGTYLSLAGAVCLLGLLLHDLRYSNKHEQDNIE